MSSFLKKTRRSAAACLLGATLALPASAGEPEVELRCEFRPTAVGAAATRADHLREANAASLRSEIADELETRRRAVRAEFSQRPKLRASTSVPR